MEFLRAGQCFFPTRWSEKAGGGSKPGNQKGEVTREKETNHERPDSERVQDSNPLIGTICLQVHS